VYSIHAGAVRVNQTQEKMMSKHLMILILAVAVFTVAAHGEDCGTMNNPMPCTNGQQQQRDDAIRGPNFTSVAARAGAA
jgi:hypothetical protein